MLVIQKTFIMLITELCVCA